MLSWIVRKLRREAPPPMGVYRPEERLIYKYWNGDREVAADPLVLHRRLMEKSVDIEINIKVFRSASKDAPAAYEALIRDVRWAFDVKPLDADGKGLTEMECVALLDHFMSLMGEEKKTSQRSSTSPSPSETPPPSSAGAPTTEPLSECGSTAAASSSAAPTSLQWGPR